MQLRRGGNYLITSQKVLSSEEQHRLLRVCAVAPDTGIEARNVLMIMLALECGLRACEVLDLRVGEFNDSQKTIFIRSKKGSRPRELPIRGPRARDLKTWILGHFNAKKLSDVDPQALIFAIGYHTLQKAWDFHRPAPLKGFHSLRHSFAVNLYSRTQNVKVVQLALGHRNIENTMVYMDFFYSQTELRRMMHGRPVPKSVEAPSENPRPLRELT